MLLDNSPSRLTLRKKMSVKVVSPQSSVTNEMMSTAWHNSFAASRPDLLDLFDDDDDDDEASKMIALSKQQFYRSNSMDSLIVQPPSEHRQGSINSSLDSSSNILDVHSRRLSHVLSQIQSKRKVTAKGAIDQFPQTDNKDLRYTTKFMRHPSKEQIAKRNVGAQGRQVFVPEVRKCSGFHTIVGHFVKKTLLHKEMPDDLMHRRMDEFVKYTILDQKRIHNNLLNYWDVYPQDLRQALEMQMKESTLKPNMFDANMGELVDADLAFYVSFNTIDTSILSSACGVSPDISSFYLPMFQKRFTSTTAARYPCSPNLLTEQLFHQHMKQFIQLFSHTELSEPFALARSMENFVSFLETILASHNKQILNLLLPRLEKMPWVDSLGKALLSPYPSIRLDICCLLAFLLCHNRLMRHLTVKGTSNCILTLLCLHLVKAIDSCPSSFGEYHTLMVLLFHLFPNFTILTIITEHGSRSKNEQFNSMWPYLVYFAIKFWPEHVVSQSRYFLVNLSSQFDKIFTKVKGKRAVRCFLTILYKRFQLKSLTVTALPDEKL